MISKLRKHNPMKLTRRSTFAKDAKIIIVVTRATNGNVSSAAAFL
jgi:hypothetical protein